MHPISNRDVNFFILEFLLIIGFILYPFTIYNSRALHFVRNFFDIFWQILNSVDCHNYQCDFLCKEHTVTNCRNTYPLQNRIFYLQTQQSFHMRHLLSTVSIVIHFCAQLIHCYYNIKIIDTQKGWISPPFSLRIISLLIFYNHSQQAFMLHCSDSAISIANSILIFELS